MHNLKNLYKGNLGGSVCLHCRRYATKKTHYEILGVSKTASQKEIKSAYIELSKKFHPDTAGARSKKKFTEINEAYSVLGKPLSRREYDNKIAFEKTQTYSSNTYGPYSRPPGSGPASYPPPGYKYGQSYDRRSDYSSTYSEEQRKREEAIRQIRQKLHEERMRKYNEFERDIYNVTTAGQRKFKKILDFYVRFVFLSAIFMTFYALSTFEPRSTTERPINWKTLVKHSPVITVQLMWTMIILGLQFITAVAIYARCNSVGGRKFRHPSSAQSKKSRKLYNLIRKHRSEVYHSVNLSIVLIVVLFGWVIEISHEEMKEFYRRMGYFRHEDIRTRRGLENEFKDLLEMFAINVFIIVFFAFLVLRFFFISASLEKRRDKERYWESPDSELRRRYEYFYGEHGEENRRRAKERAFGKKTKEEEAREVRRVVIFCCLFALASTIIQYIANGQIKVSNTSSYTRTDNVPLNPVAVVLLGLFFILCLSTGFVFRKATWHMSNIKKLDTRSRADLNRSPSDEDGFDRRKQEMEEDYDQYFRQRQRDPIVYLTRNLLNFTYTVFGFMLASFYVMKLNRDENKKQMEKMLKKEDNDASSSNSKSS